jgi:NitT/TauT family transport system substrate-binding protein
MAVALVATACGDDEGIGTGDCDTVDDVRLQLQWVTQSQFAGYYVARHLGFYGDECLNVTILEGAVDIVPQTVLATGGAEFGLAWVPKALVSREVGDAAIVNIAQVFERSGTLEVSFKDAGITSPADWAGKTVGNWGFGNEFELTAAIEKFNVQNVNLVGQSFDMLALLNGELDAAEAMIYNEYAQVLEAENPATGQLYQPSDLNVIDFNDPSVGTAMLQDAVWASESWLDQSGNEEIAERFLKASFRGWIHCLDNFQACVDVILDNGSTLGSSHQAWQLNEILGLIFPATNDIGVMNEDLWDQTVEVATTQIAELQGVSISNDAFRTDIAEAAVKALDSAGLDVDGSTYTRRDITLTKGGE